MVIKNRVLSFKYAFEGLWIALRDEPNLKFHFYTAIIVLFLSWYLEITKTEWLIIIMTIGLVISVELTNTAIEEVVNTFTSEHHPAAKYAKDVAAAAVLVVSLTAAIVGIVIFLPYILALLPNSLNI